MKLKEHDIKQAIAQIYDGAHIMVGGFGSPGTPFTLIEALLAHGATNLTVIKNDANEVGIGVGKLIDAKRVSKLITSHIGLNRIAVEQMNRGELTVEFVPQGILAERIRCAGVGLLGIVSDIGLDTELTTPEQIVEINGQLCKIEPAIRADFALIHASQADWYGNLCYAATAANFNPVMAMAADYVFVESAEILTTALDPQHIHTPGIFVDALIRLPKLDHNYQLMEHHIDV